MENDCNSSWIEIKCISYVLQYAMIFRLLSDKHCQYGSHHAYVIIVRVPCRVLVLCPDQHDDEIQLKLKLKRIVLEKNLRLRLKIVLDIFWELTI